MTAKERVIVKGKSDLLFFGRVATPSMFTMESPPFHRELSDHMLDEGIRKLLVVAPRGHAKSSLGAALLPLHHLVYHQGPRFIVLVSKTEGHAVKLLQTIKDVLDYSESFRALYGYWGRHAAKSWGRNQVELVDPRLPEGDKNNTICIMCRGANQQMRGLKYINQRPTLVVFDDPEDEENTKTEDRRSTNLEGLLKGIVPGLDAQCGRVVLIGTPIHAQGMVNIIADTPGWTSLHYSALNPVPEEELPQDREVDERERWWALWPEVWPVSRLLEERSAMERIGKMSAFYSEFMCEIVGDGDQMFPESTFRYWDGALKWDANREAYLEVTKIGHPMMVLEEPRIVPVNVFMGVDPASSTARTADYSVVFVIAVDRDLNVYCLEYFRQRVKPLQLADAIVRLYRRYHPKKTQIETVGYQAMLRDYLRRHVTEHIPGLEIDNKPRRGKTERLESLQPEFAMGKWHLRPTMQAFMDELVLFPRGKNDDTLDGAFYARKGAYRPYHDAIIREQGVAPERRAPVYDWMVE